MAELERLLRRRVAAKGWATRSANVLADLLEQKMDEEVAGVSPRLLLLDAKRECEARLAALDEVQASVECVLNPEVLEGDLEAAWSFREGIKRVLLRAAEVQHSAEAGEQVPPASASGRFGSARLPKLELPKFDGDVMKWSTFWESFECAVDQADLSEVHKLTYLRSLLVGEAKQCVEGLPLKAQHYAATCDLLKSRFGRPELIIFAHVQQLLSLGSSSETKLQDLVDQLLVQVRSLAVLGVTGQQYGVILTPLILSRLPSEVRLEWARSSVGKEGDLDNLICFLQQEISRLERSGVYEGLTSPRKTTSPGQAAAAATGRRPAFSGGRQGPAAGLLGQRGARSASRPSTAALQSAAAVGCGFCGQQHQTAKCLGWQRLSVDDRFSCVREKRLCFCCLETGHLARRCAARCVKCGGRHHVTLCATKGDEGSRRLDAGVGAREGGPTQGVAMGGGGQSESVSLSCTTNGNVTVLPVATVVVFT